MLAQEATSEDRPGGEQVVEEAVPEDRPGGEQASDEAALEERSSGEQAVEEVVPPLDETLPTKEAEDVPDKAGKQDEAASAHEASQEELKGTDTTDKKC